MSANDRAFDAVSETDALFDSAPSDALDRAPSRRMTFTPRPLGWRDVARTYADQLPFLGGAVGGAGGALVAGGLSAGTAAIPAGLAGAGAGGAAGGLLREGAYRLLGEEPASPEAWRDSPEAMRVAGRVAGAGAEQMLYQGAGELPAAAARMAAPELMRGALRPTSKMLTEFSDLNLPAEALQRRIGTPEAATAARRESARSARKLVASASRSRLTPLSETFETARPTGAIQDVAAQTARQAEAAAALRDAATKHGMEVPELLGVLSSKNPLDLAAASRRGLGALELAHLRTLTENMPETVRRMVPGKPVQEFRYAAEQFINSPQVSRLRRELANSGLPADARAELETFFESWAAQHANRTSPIKWYKLAQSLQREAKPFYGRNAAGAGQQLASSPNVQAAKAALATAIKEGLGADIKGLRAQDANTRVLIALERALKRSHSLRLSGGTILPAAIGDVAARSMGHSGLAEIPAMATAAYLGHKATSPAFLGRSALLLSNPAMAEALRQSPRAAGFGLKLLMRPEPVDTSYAEILP